MAVVVLLDRERGRQQALKGLLVQRQICAVRGHGIGGRRIVQAEPIVVQSATGRKGENAEGYSGGIPERGFQSGRDL